MPFSSFLRTGLLQKPIWRKIIFTIGFFLSFQNIQAEIIEFPENFKWCIATSAHQIEGANYNSDWWAFEQKPNSIPSGDSSEKGTDHWNRVEEDTLLMKNLGIDTYRFSIEWAKIEPIEGIFDLSVLEHYKNEIQILRREGITPMVTLLHFTLPKWLADKGGLLSESFPNHFIHFTNKVYETLGDKVDTWITFNEVLSIAAQGYLKNEWPPQFEAQGDKHRLETVFQVIKNSLLAHMEAYNLLHELASEADREISVGMAHSLAIIKPVPLTLKRNLMILVDLLGANFFDKSYNWFYLDAFKHGVLKWKIPGVVFLKEEIPSLKDTLDFIGINYYARHHIQMDLSASTTEKKFQMIVRGEYDDMGLESYPKGIEEILLKVHKKFPTLPVYITENGIADGSDKKRTYFIKEHLKHIHQAIKKGVNVRGYCYWTLIDNFEWTFGYQIKYGLYSLDSSMSRIPRDSVDEFKKIIKNNGFTE